MTCKFGAPTQDGSKCSNMRMINSSIGRAARFLMLKEPRMKKVMLSVFGPTTVVNIKNGLLFILTKQRVLKLRDLTKILVSM